jgi:hypothetical protein
VGHAGSALTGGRTDDGHPATRHGERSGCGGKGNVVVNTYQTVYGVTRGWYEIVYGGQRRYIAGWATPGRH